MTNRVSWRRVLAIAALTLVAGAAGDAEDRAADVAGRWQYLQLPDSEGEVLDLENASGRWRGIMNGLERAGEHGLFYYVVEIENLVVEPDGRVSFEIGERTFFFRRPALSVLGGNGDAGVARGRMHFTGRIDGEDLVLRCDDDDGSCPDSMLLFRKLTTTPVRDQPSGR